MPGPGPHNAEIGLGFVAGLEAFLSGVNQRLIYGKNHIILRFVG
jgi:hypothetical protein